MGGAIYWLLYFWGVYRNPSSLMSGYSFLMTVLWFVFQASLGMNITLNTRI